MKVILLVIGVLLAASVVAGAVMMAVAMDGHWGMMGRGSDPDDEPQLTGVTAIDIDDFAYKPANVRVTPGTTITWTNRDAAAHTVTSRDGDELDSELLGQGESYAHTFDQPGTFEYYCKPHPYMKGLVTVEP